MAAASAGASGASRMATSARASAVVPPRPHSTMGPNTGSRRAPPTRTAPGGCHLLEGVTAGAGRFELVDSRIEFGRPGDAEVHTADFGLVQHRRVKQLDSHGTVQFGQCRVRLGTRLARAARSGGNAEPA